MILIPEIETVVILVPRTGTTALIRAIKHRYPDAIRLYRHMEADGIPRGYDQWAKVGVVRNPLHRLFSLYCYLKTFDGPYPEEYLESQRASVDRDFSDWILNNETPFTNPYDTSGNGKFYPQYMIGHNLPENRKSQYVYLRPDLGTVVYRYESELRQLEHRLNILLPRGVNASSDFGPMPPITKEVQEYVKRAFSWDFYVTGAHTVAL